VIFSSPKNSLSSQGAAVSHPYLLTASTDGVAKLWHVKQAKRADQGEQIIQTSLTISHPFSG
jgi:hypothetical protein